MAKKPKVPIVFVTFYRSRNGERLFMGSDRVIRQPAELSYSEFCAELEEAGFVVGDEAVIVERGHFERLERLERQRGRA